MAVMVFLLGAFLLCVTFVSSSVFLQVLYELEEKAELILDERGIFIFKTYTF